MGAAFLHFRGHIDTGPHIGSPHVVSQHQIGRPKVAHFNLVVSTNQNILRFDISVQDRLSKRMQILKSLHYTFHIIFCQVFWQSLVLFDHLVQVTLGHVL